MMPFELLGSRFIDIELIFFIRRGRSVHEQKFCAEKPDAFGGVVFHAFNIGQSADVRTE